MKLVVISPEHDDPRETAVLGELFALGLERYHVRKPHATAAQLEAWLRSLPQEWRARLVLHQHHELSPALGLGGVHFRDGATPAGTRAGITSRACHDLPALRAALGRFESVFFSPVFPSLSKPGHGPRDELVLREIEMLLAQRTTAERRTAVLALGGITPKTAPRAAALGFDGLAVLGAVWLAPDPVRAFAEIQAALSCHAP